MSADKRAFRWDGRFVQIIELIFDILFIVFGFYIAIYIGDNKLFKNMLDVSIWDEIVYEMISIISSNILFIFLSIILFRVYRVSLTKKRYFSSLLSVALSLLLANLITQLFNIVFNIVTPAIHQDLGLHVFVLTFLIQLFLIGLGKCFLWKLMIKHNVKNVIIIGPKEEALKLATKFFLDSKHYMRLKYCYFEKDSFLKEEVFYYIEQCDYVYITQSTSSMNKSSIINYCISKRHLTAYLIPQLYEIAILNSHVEQIDDVLAFGIDSFQFSLEQRIIKRIFDIVVSFFAIIILSPIMLITIIALKIENVGPVFFKQIRVTKGGKQFEIIKFRSMFVDEKKCEHQRAVENDARITKIGNIIRKTRIDEFPQLFHVLSGKMSMIGPRALCREEIEEFTSKNPNFKYRFNVKAGLTGAAQANATSGISFEERLNFDLLDIRNYSLQYDIKILFLTIRTMLDGKMSTGVSNDDKLTKKIQRINLHYKKESDMISFDHI